MTVTGAIPCRLAISDAVGASSRRRVLSWALERGGRGDAVVEPGTLEACVQSCYQDVTWAKFHASRVKGGT